MALQEALLEEEKGSGPFAWIGSKIPMALHNNKIWRTIFWVSCPAAGASEGTATEPACDRRSCWRLSNDKHVCLQLSPCELQ